MKTLLVDDEDAILRLLKDVLETHGFTVTTASSARDGIAALARESFDLVITDLKMESPTSGFEVVEAAGQLKPRPVITILSAFPVAAADWKNAGADALFVKGSDIFGLAGQLKKLLKAERPS
jgi:DNA-binding response OmpR family regulator